MATPIDQLDAMRKLRENWDGYGAAAPQGNLIDLAQEFISLIEAMLRKSTAEPGLLHVSPTRIGGILIDWEDRSMQHEMELNPDSSIGFLHLNKTAGSIQSRKVTPGAQVVVDPGLLQELRQLLAEEDPGHAEIQSGQASLDDHACRKKLALLFRFIP
jgi:hypothetical protein